MKSKYVVTDEAVTDAAVTGIDLSIATGRDKHDDPTEMTIGDAPAGATPREQMRLS